MKFGEHFTWQCHEIEFAKRPEMRTALCMYMCVCECGCYECEWVPQTDKEAETQEGRGCHCRRHVFWFMPHFPQVFHVLGRLATLDLPAPAQCIQPWIAWAACASLFTFDSHAGGAGDSASLSINLATFFVETPKLLHISWGCIPAIFLDCLTKVSPNQLPNITC